MIQLKPRRWIIDCYEDMRLYAASGFILGTLFSLLYLIRTSFFHTPGPVILGKSLAEAMKKQGITVEQIQQTLQTSEPSLLTKWAGIILSAIIAGLVCAVIAGLIGLVMKESKRKY